MKRKDTVLQALRSLGEGETITASKLGEQLGLSRANVSSDLNRLCDVALAMKRGRKPVEYMAATVPVAGGPGAAAKNPAALDHDFDAFVRENPSLSPSVELAKAAVLYPPAGMHILLFGETGVGKSMFASHIYHFALSQRRIAESASFVTFNCADYANNAQLLISQLFGASKGAYTGADRDRLGLIEQADGGILFLDEIHRLPPEGQEMLFTYIDRGVFRRLGETAGERKVSVLLICATSENPQSTLLRTFVRRIPMFIQIPNLFDRSLDERAALIDLFFAGESCRFGQKIRVSVNSMRALLGYTCPGNVGQLKSDIQLLCAMAYAQYISREKDFIGINSFSLPPHIRNGFFTEHNRKEIWNRVLGIGGRYLEFTPQGQDKPREGAEEPSDIYRMLEQQTLDMRRVGMAEEDIRAGQNTVVDRYYTNLKDSAADLVTLNEIERLIGPEILATVDRMLRLGVDLFGAPFGANIRWALGMHLHNAIKRVQAHQDIINPRLEDIQQNYPQQFAIARACLDIIYQDFGISFPEDEAGFIALFFDPHQEEAQKKSSLQIIVTAHGTGTATGMAQTANQLIGTDLAVGFDMSLQENPNTTYQKIKEFLIRKPEIRELFLLVDMGSPTDFARQLAKELGLRAEHCVLASTMHVMEACRKALLGYPLHRVAEDTRKITRLALAEGEHPIIVPAVIPSALPPDAEQLFFITACTTGTGNAAMLKQILDSRLDLKEGTCKIISLPITHRDRFTAAIRELADQGRIIGAASVLDTGLRIPHFPLEGILDGSALGDIQALINIESLFAHMIPTIIPMLDHIDGAVVSADIRTALEQMSAELQMLFNGETLVGTFCHIAFMMNRLKKEESVAPFPGKEGFLKKFPQVISAVGRECRFLGTKYGVTIPLDEICYIAAFFTKEDIFSPAAPGV
ncbi:sigma-54 factor interaction domain protein [Treponema primitia ZAS-2]|uniref:Sigma-54 factor interaction domain protein n=1 Tax=Treponema primitia (strain ATCC BAA-887 / DSM 12427 / ZAS-2) TaxID=545694 RepID=F5YM41_TREPZ|nr:sigma-54-dependent transcriptional regulator [Treponema primitia]AEF86930.1 sigma-54 factor interaction domain protein [Treponema primitia ZAS-2]